MLHGLTKAEWIEAGIIAVVSLAVSVGGLWLFARFVAQIVVVELEALQ